MNPVAINILLVDDNHNDNFFHERVIKKVNVACIVITLEDGLEALMYLMSTREGKIMLPDLIFLNINMPGMNG